jgi:hypothetical protein
MHIPYLGKEGGQGSDVCRFEGRSLGCQGVSPDLTISEARARGRKTQDTQVQGATIISTAVLAPLMPHGTQAMIRVDHSSR